MLHRSRLLSLPFLAILPASAAAQGLPDVFVSDSNDNQIWRCTDVDQNGDYNGSSETAVFYDDALGAVPLTFNAAVWYSPDGAVWVSDTDEDVLVRLVDLDADGTANGAGEATVWFDGRAGGNAEGVLMWSARGLWRDPDGVFYVASNNTTSGGEDAILRLEDLNQDGDANDAGESLEFYKPSPGGALGDSIPTAIVRGADGAFYYAENGIGTNPPRGAYRLEDLDGSGTIDQPNEVSAFFLAPPQAGNAFHWEITIGPDGTIYLGDNGNEIIWRLVDANMDGVIDPATEANPFWSVGVPSTIWDIDVASDGSLYVAEDQTPDRLFRLVDANADGSIDPATEVFEIYSENVSPNAFGSAQALAVVDGPQDVGTPYCGPAVVNSSGASAEISAVGTDRVAENDLTLEATSLPRNSFAFFLTADGQGFLANPGGSQGNLCLSGSIGRYVGPGQIQNAGLAGTVRLDLDLTQHPTPNGLIAVQAGETWYFTTWFRDSVGGAPTSNFSDGLSVTFR
ncbi:MAG: hypothetical protein AAGB93_05260 [Planctomycetota bacterium]